MTAIRSYFEAAAQIVRRVSETQAEAIETAAQRCAKAIGADHLVHLFGSGHSRMAVEEIWPRYGSFPGFHPIVELSLTFHNQVVGQTGSGRRCSSRTRRDSRARSCATSGCVTRT